MTALGAAFNRQRKGMGRIHSYPIEDNKKCYKGGLAVIDSSGYVLPATDATSITCVGVFDETVDNTLTGHTAGGKSIRVVSGAQFLFAATATQDETAVAGTALIVDDNTVQISATTHSAKAGRVTTFVDATHLWFEIPVAGVGSNP